MRFSDHFLHGEDTEPPAVPDPLAVIADIATRGGITDITRRCNTAQLQAEAREVTVAVLGHFKAGKTTLLNQLLGTNLLPVQAVPATAVITRIRFGPHLSARVTTTDGASFAVEAATLPEWITETGNPGNRRGVAQVHVETPALADLDHLILVDTPGTGSTWEHNTATSLRWLPHVGAALVAISAVQPLSRDDLALIELIAPHTPTLHIILTKIDLLTDHDLEAVTAHVRRQVQIRTHTDPAILSVSNADRHRPERERLRRLLRELNLTHDGVSASLLAHRTLQLAHECRAYLGLARASAMSKQAAIDDLRSALLAEAGRLPLLAQQSRAQLQPIGQAMIETAQRQVRGAQAASMATIARELALQLPSWKGSLAGESEQFRLFLRQSLTAQLTPFASQVRQSLQPLMDEGLEPVRHMGEAFLHRLGQLVSAAIGHNLKLPPPDPIRSHIDPIDITLNPVFDSHLELLSWAIPMPLVRPAVHRHFLSMLPWEVEKNLNRTAYTAVAAAKRALQLVLNDYVARLAEILEDCTRLVHTLPDDLPAIETDLQALDSIACPRPPEVSEVAG